jgi:hypothetical protein
MKLLAHLQILLCLLLGLELAVALPPAPAFSTGTDVQETSDSSEPVNTDETQSASEVTLSTSRKLARQIRRETLPPTPSLREAPSETNAAFFRHRTRLMSGQGSLAGRSLPIHC